MINKKITKQDKSDDNWHSSVAFTLGKATGKMLKGSGRVMDTIEGSVKKTAHSFNMRMDDLTSPIKNSDVFVDVTPGNKTKQSRSLEPFNKDTNQEIYSVLQEIQELADLSGLTATLNEMKLKALRYSNDPALAKFISQADMLTPNQQEFIASRFIEKITNKPFFNEIIMPLKSSNKRSNKTDHKILASELMTCLYEAFKECGLLEHDYKHIHTLTEEISEPLIDLLEFYSNPKTFTEKLKRLWKLQRIGFKTINIIRKANRIAENQELPESRIEIQSTVCRRNKT